jgi:predicted heme/steroid binding protein
MKKIVAILFLCIIIVITGCSTNQPKKQSTNNPPQIKQNTSQQKEFTLEDLKKYNGQNGNPAYVAVNGNIYDVTNLKQWKNGKHPGCKSASAGIDISKLMNSSPHGSKILDQAPVVGKLKQ